MATVKKANVPPTHPSVWAGLGLATIGLLLAVYSYTGGRVYDILYSFVALGGGFLALVGIFTAAWGRSIMAARAGRARRSLISSDALAVGRPAEEGKRGGTSVDADRVRPATSEDAPTIAVSAEKKRFSFALPKRTKSDKKDTAPAGVFAFKRREPAPEPMPAEAPPEPLVRLADAEPVRVTLRCPACASQFTAEGTRPFQAVCSTCGFTAQV